MLGIARFSIRPVAGLMCMLGLVLLLVTMATAAGGEVPFGPEARINPGTSDSHDSLYAPDVDEDWDIPFTTHVITVSAEGAYSVHAADLDSDGDLDVLSASRYDNTVAWYENKGGPQPTFTSHVITTTAYAAYCVHAADLDSDGDLDVLSASRDDDTVAWYENDGASPPSFTSYVITTAADGAYWVDAADLDSDGDVDVLSASREDDTVAWYENSGASPPSFTRYVITTNADGAYSVHAADLDGDGDLDVLSASRDDDTVAWYENNGDPQPSFTRHIITTSADAAVSVHAADLDSDGDLDVLSASGHDDTLAWYENDGASPPSFTSHVITTDADEARSIHAADLDGDGNLDVLSASISDDTVAWYENDGASPPSFTSHVITTNASGAHSVYVADLDTDGDLDVLSASREDDTVAWYRNETIHRSASFPVQGQAVIDGDADNVEAVHAADMDGDGDLDVLAAARVDDMVVWYKNEGGSPPAFTRRAITIDADGATSVHAADLDGDGDLDVLASSRVDNRVAWYENEGGSSPAFADHHVITANADGAYSVYAADLDGDGDPDVLSASQDDDKVAWYENDGSSLPGFTAHEITTDLDGAVAVFAADLDGDGDLDALASARFGDMVVWYENSGGSPPAFSAHVITTDTDGAVAVYAADLDGDGDLDVLASSQSDNKIAWYENEGGSHPAFTGHVITTNAVRPYSVRAADLDGDGDLDVLSASIDDDTVAWYENDGSSLPGFVAHEITTGAAGAAAVYGADLDGDGDLDVVSASSHDDTVAWYENRGGQFGLETTDTAPGLIGQGEEDDILRIVATHRGRSGDAEAELATLELAFEDSAGDPLTTNQANSLIENLHIYRDNDGSGSFEPGSDSLVTTVGALSLVAGTQIVAFTPGQAEVGLAYGTPVTLFVVVELANDAASQALEGFRVTHVTESSSTARYRDHDLPLTLEFAPNEGSTVWLRRSGYLPLVLGRHCPGEPVTNGGFETGDATGWQLRGDDPLPPPSVVSADPFEGSYHLLLGDPSYHCVDEELKGDRTSIATQSICVPGGSGTPLLKFQYRVVTYDHLRWTTGELGDSFDVYVQEELALRDNYHNPGQAAPGCDNQQDSGWRTPEDPWGGEGAEVHLDVLDLSEWKGQRVEVRFELWTRHDGYYNTWAYLDDVRVEIVP